MSATLTNQPLIQKSMNGIITISDGIAVMENGSLTNVSNIDTNSINTASFSSNDFQVTTNIDLLSATSKINFTNPSGNGIYTNVSTTGITTDALVGRTLNLTGTMVSDINMNTHNITNVNNINVSTINGSAPGVAQNLSSVLAVGNSAGAYDINMNTHNITNVNNINVSTINGSAPASSQTLAQTLTLGNTANQDINMNTFSINGVNNINLSTINGVAPGGLQNLSSVLTQGNTANMDINVNGFQVTNISSLLYQTSAVNQYSIYAGSATRATNLFSYRGGAYGCLCIGFGTPDIATVSPYNTIIGDFAGNSLAVGATNNTATGINGLYICTTGRDNTAVGGSALNNIILGSRNIGIGAYAGSPFGVTGYDCSACIFIGTASRTSSALTNSIVFGNDAIATANNQIMMGTSTHQTQFPGSVKFGTGIQQAYKTSTLSANTSFASTWYDWCGVHIYINQSGVGSWTMTLGDPATYTGCISWIKNISTTMLTLSTPTGTFGGCYGNASATIALTPQQTFMLVANNGTWDVVDILGVRYNYEMYNTATQTISGVPSANVLFPTTNTGFITATNGTNTWAGSKLTYSAGTFTNSTGFPMTISVCCSIRMPLNATAKFCWIQFGGTHNTANPPVGMKYFLGNATQGGCTEATFLLCNGDSFVVNYQGAVGDVIGSATLGQYNTCRITRIG